MKARKPRAPAPAWPWDSVDLTLAEISAIKTISPAALAVIMKLCGVGKNPFTNGGDDGCRATDFGCGMLHVGHTLRATHAMAMPSPTRGPPPDLPNSPTPATPDKS